MTREHTATSVRFQPGIYPFIDRSVDVDGFVVPVIKMIKDRPLRLPPPRCQSITNITPLRASGAHVARQKARSSGSPR
jgi:hypothetical protein